MKLVITDVILLLLFNSRMFTHLFGSYPLDCLVNFPSLLKYKILWRTLMLKLLDLTLEILTIEVFDDAQM